MENLIPAHLLQASGIYIIRNTVNHKVYIGSAKFFKRRFQIHLSQLQNKKHHSVLLQRFADKYGLATLRFELLEECSPESLLSREQYYIDSFQAASRVSGFNICLSTNSPIGVKRTAETILKIKAASTGRKHSQETKDKIRSIVKGRAHSPETKAKIGAANKAKGFTAEARAASKAFHLGRKETPEQTEARVSKTRGKKRTPEQIEKSRSKNLGQKRTPEQIANMKAGHLKSKSNGNT